MLGKFTSLTFSEVKKLDFNMFREYTSNYGPPTLSAAFKNAFRKQQRKDKVCHY